jgi:hypothetical protein
VLTTHPLLEPRSRKGKAIPSPSRPVQACNGTALTSTFNNNNNNNNKPSFLQSKLRDFAEHYGAHCLRVNLTISEGRNNLHIKCYRILYKKIMRVKADKMEKNENWSQGDRLPILS